MSKKQLTQLDLQLEKLYEDQRIISQERQRLERLKETEAAQEAIERAKKSKDVTSELDKALKLQEKQDQALKTGLKELTELRQIKNEQEHAQKDLDDSTKDQVNDLSQKLFELQRQKIVGQEKINKEIQDKALENFTTQKKDELTNKQAELEVQIKQHAQQRQNSAGLAQINPLFEQINEIEHNIELLKLASNIKSSENATTDPELMDKFNDLEKIDQEKVVKFLELNESEQSLEDLIDTEQQKLQNITTQIKELGISPDVMTYLATPETQGDVVSEAQIIEQSKIAETSKKIYQLETEITNLEKELTSIEKAGIVDLSPKLAKQLEQEQQKLKDAYASKQEILKQEVYSIDDKGQTEALKLVKEGASLNEKIRKQEQIIQNLTNERSTTTEQIKALEKEFRELEKAEKSKPEKTIDHPEIGYTYPSQNLQNVQLQKDVTNKQARDKLKLEQEQLIKSLQDQIKDLQSASETLQTQHELEKETIKLEYEKTLKNLIAQKDKEIDDARKSNPRFLSDELRDFEQESNKVTKLEDQIKNLENQLTEATKAKENSGQEILSLQDQINKKDQETQNKLAELTKEKDVAVQLAKEESQAKQQALNEATNKLSALNTTNTELQTQLQQAQADFDSGNKTKQTEIAELQSQLAANKELLNTATQEKESAIKAAQQAKEQAQEAVKTQMDELSLQVKQAKEESQAKQQALNEANTNLSRLEKDKNLLQSELGVTNRKIQQAGSDKTALSEEIIKLQEQMEQNKIAQDAERENLTQAKLEALEAAQKAQETSALQIESLQKESEARKADLDKVTKEVLALNTTNTELQSKLQQAQADFDSGNKAKQSEVESLQSQLDANKELLNTATQEKETAIKEAQQAKQEADVAAKAQIEELRSQAQLAKEESQAKQQALNEATNKLSTLTATNTELQSKLGQAQAEVTAGNKSKKEEVAELQSQLAINKELLNAANKDKESALLEAQQAKEQAQEAVKTQMDELSLQVKQAKEESQAKQQALNEANTNLSRLEKDKNLLQSELGVTNRKIQQAGSDKTALSKEIIKLQEQMEQNKLAQDAEREKLTQAKLEALEAAKKAQETSALQIESLQKESEARKADLEKITTEVSTLNTTNTELQTQLKQAQADFDSGNKAKQSEVESLQSQLVANKELLNTATQDKETALKEAQQAKENLETQEKASKQLQESLDTEIANLTDKLQSSEKRVQNQQQELESIELYLSELDDRIDSLSAQLIIAEEDIEDGIGNKEILGTRIVELEQELTEAREERDEAVIKEHKAKEFLKEFQEFHEQELERHDKERLDHQEHQPGISKKTGSKEQDTLTENHQVATKISDRVSTVSDDQMLKDFRELREMQRDVIASKIQGAPKENEAFHKYASQEGAAIAMALDSETSRLIADIEHEQYKKIHSDYPHSNIDWQGKDQVNINKDGVELCQLSNKPSAPPLDGYKLDGQKIVNYRSLELPLEAKSGPMHISLAVKDLQGKNVSEKDAVYLTAHYDKQGKLVEMTAPIPVYYTDKDRKSPVCIKRDGKIYSLPVNRGQYEDMLKQIEKNKGLEAELSTDLRKNPEIAAGQKDSLTQDLVSIRKKISPHNVSDARSRAQSSQPSNVKTNQSRER